MNSLANDIRIFFKSDDVLNRLIVINVLIFLVFGIITTFQFLTQSQSGYDLQLLNFAALPAALDRLAYRPWTLVSYMFTQVGFMHLLFNMLWLYWIGGILREMLGDRKLVGAYIAGGLAGAVVYIAAYNLLPVFKGVLPVAYNYGSSAAVMSVVVAAATIVPDYEIRLLLFGNVRLKWLAIVYVLLDVIGIGVSNAGGHFSHLGGAVFGFVAIKLLRNGNDIITPFDVFGLFSNLFKAKPKMKVLYGEAEPTLRKRDSARNQAEKKRNDEDELNRILDKISQSGYDNLNKAEREFLFTMSEKK